MGRRRAAAGGPEGRCRENREQQQRQMPHRVAKCQEPFRQSKALFFRQMNVNCSRLTTTGPGFRPSPLANSRQMLENE